MVMDHHHHRMPNSSFASAMPLSAGVSPPPPATNNVGGPQPRHYNSFRPALVQEYPPVASHFAGDNIFPFLHDWHPAHQSCQRYFVDEAQHSPLVQALA